MNRALIASLAAVSCAMGLIHGGALFFYWRVGNPTALEWSTPLKLAQDAIGHFECPKMSRVVKAATDEGVCEPASTNAKKHLDVLVQRAVVAGNTHLFFAAKLFAFHYMALLGGLIAAGLVAMATFAIATAGWANTSVWIRLIFVFTSVSLAFWIAVPQVFKYQENIETAEKIYAASAALIWDLRTFAASGRTKDGKWQKTHEVLAIARERMDQIERIGLAFDQSKVGIGGVQTPASLGQK